MGLENEIIQLGLVSLKELKWLYQNSISLVMPTLLGPTNMPLMEAYFLGCNVICSDFAGHREQLGDYAFYFDPLNAEDMANQMDLVYSKYQTNKNEVIPYNNQHIINALEKIFDKAKKIRRNWGTKDDIS